MQESLRTLRLFRARPHEQSSLGCHPGATTLESGLPPGCIREIIDETCREATGKSVSDTRFRHLSSWKPHGAFLVEATMSDGEVMAFVSKRTVATPGFNPILDRLPFTPGPAEFAVLGSPPGNPSELSSHGCSSSSSWSRVEYVMVAENLDTSHRRLGRDDVTGLVDRLRDLHAALAEHASGPQT